MEVLLDARVPGWRNSAATHVNRNEYSNYNNLAALNIFELNRLREVILQLSSDQFVSDVFSVRDQDVHNAHTEIGGVIPKLGVNHLLVIPARKEIDNLTYVLPGAAVIELFRSPAAFHFHSTQVEEPASAHGPSFGDHAFFGPGVTFSSVDTSTIAVHFYTSRATWQQGGKLTVKNEVIYLGLVRKSEK